MGAISVADGKLIDSEEALVKIDVTPDVEATGVGIAVVDAAPGVEIAEVAAAPSEVAAAPSEVAAAAADAAPRSEINLRRK